MAGEDELVERLRRRWSGARAPRGTLGIGDDAAVVPVRAGDRGALLVTTDLFLEGVHFDLSWTPASCVGSKALHAAASDVGAMGGEPTGCLVSIASPRRIRSGALDEILASVHRAALGLGIPVLGGDLSRSVDRLALDVVVLGRPAGRSVLRRDGGRPGHVLYVTGPLGGSAAGLGVLRARPRLGARIARALSSGRPPERIAAKTDAETAAAVAHLAPRPPLAAGAAFGRSSGPSAMMDVSDGLAIDLRRLCRASRAGARIETDSIPLHAAAVELLGRSGALRAALGGGEDYALLLAAPGRREAALRRQAERSGAELVRIGRVTGPSAGLRLEGPDGKSRPLPRSGFDHFVAGGKGRG